jgi:hypothetical protein
MATAKHAVTNTQAAYPSGPPCRGPVDKPRIVLTPVKATPRPRAAALRVTGVARDAAHGGVGTRNVKKCDAAAAGVEQGTDRLLADRTARRRKLAAAPTCAQLIGVLILAACTILAGTMRWSLRVDSAPPDRQHQRHLDQAVWCATFGAVAEAVGTIGDVAFAAMSGVAIRSASNALSMSRVRNAGSSDVSQLRSQTDDASGLSDCRRWRTSAPSKTLRRVSRARSCLPSRDCSVFFCASSCAKRCSMVLRAMMPSVLMLAMSECRASTCGSAR